MSEEFYKTLLRERTFSDLKLFIGPNGKEYDVHRNIMIKSDFFRRAMLGGFKEANSQEIVLPDITEEQMDILLEFIYTDKFDWKNVERHEYDLGGLYESADYLCLDTFKKAFLVQYRECALNHTPPLDYASTKLDTMRKIYECTPDSERAGLKVHLEDIADVIVLGGSIGENLAMSQDPFHMELKRLLFKKLDDCFCKNCENQARRYYRCTHCGSKLPTS